MSHPSQLLLQLASCLKNQIRHQPRHVTTPYLPPPSPLPFFFYYSVVKSFPVPDSLGQAADLPCASAHGSWRVPVLQCLRLPEA